MLSGIFENLSEMPNTFSIPVRATNSVNKGFYSYSGFQKDKVITSTPKIAKVVEC